MALRNYINTSVEGQLLNPIGTGDTTITLSGSGLVNIPTTPFYVRIDPDTASEEVILVGSGSSATTFLNCTRGYDGTTAFSHSAGAKIRHVVVAEFFNAAHQHVEATANVHGLSGGAVVVGTTSTQTLTNKTINSSTFDTSHTTAPAGSQHYRALADNASSRNGFTWENTGGSSGKAFLARVSGVDRTYISGGGDLVVGGATTTNGITNSTGGITSTGTFTNTGVHNNVGNLDVTGTVHATGAVDFDSTLNVDGNTTLVGTVNTGAATLASASVTGAATVGTTLGVTGNTTLSGTLAVTGDQTFTGNATFPVPGAGTPTRLTIKGRTGSVLLNGRNQSDSTTSRLYETGLTEFFDKSFIHNGSSPVIAVVSGTGVIPSPTTNLVAWDTSDSLVKKYNGSSFDTVGTFGANNYVRYSRSTDQNISNNTITKVAFTTADVTDTSCVTVASSTDFTLVKAGRYLIESNAMMEQDSVGSRYYFVADASNSNTRYGVTTKNPNNSSPVAFQVFVLRRFAANTVVSVYCYQDSGATQALTGSLPSLCPMHVNFTWLGP